MKSILSRLPAHLQPHLNAIKALMVFSAVSNILMLMPTIYMLQVFDRVMVSRSELTLVAVSLVALYLFTILGLTEWSRSRLLARLGAKLDAELSSQTFHGVFASELAAHKEDAQHNAQKVSPAKRAFADLAELRQFVAGSGLTTLIDLPWTVVYVVILFLMHPFLGVLALAFSLLQALFTRYGHLHVVQPTHQSNQQAAIEIHDLQSKMKDADTATALGMTDRLKKTWLIKSLASQVSHAKAQQLQHTVSSASKFIRYMQQSFTLAVGALLVMRGEISPGAMIAANVLCSRALAPIDTMASSWRSLLSAREAYKRLTHLLTQTRPHSQPKLAKAIQGDVLIRQVSLRLPNRKQPVLHEIQYHAAAGSVTLVMGPSGSGKSSLARVLLGIWPASTGEVMLDAVPINDWPKEQAGPMLGYLPQSIDLFDATIASNIARLGPIDASAVVVAAKMTGLHELILRLPNGYETAVGEAGYLLSGGMRQRIGLARAVYGNPKLVVLDEPNANLDDAGEKALAQTLMTLKSQGSTVFVISHRNHLMEAADRMLVLADGQVQASGPYDGVVAAMMQHT
jgi:ATP-binding cassette, subfamily C, bacterial exporter for protease/lipase